MAVEPRLPWHLFFPDLSISALQWCMLGRLGMLGMLGILGMLSMLGMLGMLTPQGH